MAKCPICNSKKGKRQCIRVVGVICSLCCGETRQKETCADCSYYKDAVIKRNYNVIPAYSTEEMERNFDLQEHANVIEGEMCAFDKSSGEQMNDAIAIEILERLLDHYYFKDEELKFSHELAETGLRRLFNAIQKDLPEIKEEILIKIIAVIRFVARRRSTGHRDYLSIIQTHVGERVTTGLRHTSNILGKENRFMARIDLEIDEKIDQALMLMENGNQIKGEALIIEIHRKHPDLYMAQYARGVAYALNEQYDESIICFDNAINIFPYFSEAWFNKGTSYKEKMNQIEMTNAYQKAIQYGNPEDEHIKMAKSLLSDFGESIKKEHGILLDEYLRTEVLFNDAFTHMLNGNFEKAISEFQKVQKVVHNHPQALGNLGLCYAFLGKKKDAIKAFDKALKLDPTYEPAIINKRNVALLEEGECLPFPDKIKAITYY